ncbi:MAG TPA: zinc-binding dehydrogenase [Gemmatimonadales bacterium]|nr:zinc-binding dehydrogenase [Gemmatimonadales bacterium]
MRALTLTALGGLEHLAVADVPEPLITAPDEIRVRMAAAAINRLDIFVAQGLPKFILPFPHIVGSDGAGIIDAVGREVTAFQVGDRVMLNPGISCGECGACRRGEHSLCERYAIFGEHRSGTIAEYVVVPAVNAAHVPDAMSWAEAAAFPLATLTAWRMLTTRARLAPNETVLVWGSGGGVSQAAIQVAHHLGAEVIATGGRAETRALARRLGADHVVDHVNEDVVAEVRRITGRRGAQVVVDSVGEKTWPLSLRCLARGGRLVTCGATTGPMVGLDVRRLFWHQWSILGSTMGGRSEYRAVAALAQQGLLRPVIDTTVPLDRAIDAFRRLHSGAQAGKIAIEVTP